MEVSVDAHDTADDLIDVISSYLDVKFSAFQTITDELALAPEEIPPSPTNYFKCGTILSVDNDEKDIHIQYLEIYPYSKH